jgi:hypothetical protein
VIDRPQGLFVKAFTATLMCVVALLGGSDASGADYSKRAQALDPSIRTRLIGRWTNPVDRVVVEFTSIDLESGQVRGKEWPTTGPASASEHDIVGWVSGAPPRDGFDNVIPVSFSTTLFEYGTLPVWAGFLRGDSLVTMHYLIWPNRTYSWDHISTFQETWVKEVAR